jgi:hypothetical protein
LATGSWQAPRGGDRLSGARILEVTVIVRVDAPQPAAARHTQHCLHREAGSDHVDVRDSSPDPHYGFEVVMGLGQRRLAVVGRAAPAAGVDDGASLDGLTAAGVLPTAHLDGYVHGRHFR